MGFTGVRIESESHESNRLAPIAEWLLPFLASVPRHLVLAGVFVPGGPPLAGSSAM
jgi:hypothetical protein